MRGGPFGWRQQLPRVPRWGRWRPWDTCTRPSQEGKGQSGKVRSPILPVLMSHVVAPCQPGVAENSWKWHLQEPEWVVCMVI